MNSQKNKVIKFNKVLVEFKYMILLWYLAYLSFQKQSMELVTQPGTSTQETNVKECFRIICPASGKLLHLLPVMPNEVILFQERKKIKEKEKSIEILTQEIIKTLSSNSGNSTINFNVKSLAEELGDDVKRVYDICNVFEALGIVIKKKVNTFCWFGIYSEHMIETLRHLKTIAESENLHSLILNREVVTGNQETLKLNLQVLTEKMMMLFLLLDSHEGFTKSQLYSFIYRADETKASGVLRISKVLKIVQTLGLLSSDWVCVDFEGNNLSNLQKFRYTGPTITSVGDHEENQLGVIRDQALASNAQLESQEHHDHHSLLDESFSQRVTPIKITYEILMLDDIEESIVNEEDPRGAIDVEFIGGFGETIIGRKDMTVRDEILGD